MVFPVVMYGCESWTVKKAEHWRIDAFELWCWRRLLRVPWTARRSHQSILKEISPGCSLEGLMLTLKLQYFGHLMWKVDSLEKTLMLGGIGGRRRKGLQEDEMARWHHWLHAHEFEWTPGVGDGQGGLSSVQFSHSVVADSLRPHGLQHARPPCPSPTPGVHSNSHPSSQWCHPAISSSVVPFSSCPQFLLASESFPMSQLFAWGGQSIGVSALASVLPKNTQDWSPLEWTGWISLQSKGLSRVFSNTTVQKHQVFGTQLSSQSNSHIHTWLLEKP